MDKVLQQAHRVIDAQDEYIASLKATIKTLESIIDDKNQTIKVQESYIRTLEEEKGLTEEMMDILPAGALSLEPN